MTKIVPAKWYSARKAADLLGIAEDTVKKYCRDPRKFKIEARQIGPKKRWHLKGSSIKDKRREWGLE